MSAAAFRRTLLVVLVMSTLLGAAVLCGPRHAPAAPGGLPAGDLLRAGGGVVFRWVAQLGRRAWREAMAYDRMIRYREAVRRRLVMGRVVRTHSEPSFRHLLACGTVLTHLALHDKRVALTFDDGPSPLTPRTLQILARHGARATFFLVGRNAGRFPELVKAIREGGHEIENHTYSHELGYPYTPTQFTLSPLDHQLEEVQKTDRVLHEHTRFLRVPGGLFGPCWGSVEAARETQKIIVNWDVDGDTPGWQHIAKGRIIGMQPNDLLAAYEARILPGSIVLMHPENRKDAPYTLQILERLIVDLQKRGYRLVTLDELLLGDILAHH